MKPTPHCNWLPIVRNAAFATFSRRDEATAWLNAPSRILGGLAPLKAATSRLAAERILSELDRLRSGLPSRPFGEGKAL